MEILQQSKIEPVPYKAFIDQLDWKQGEHVALVGPTGQGKTTLSLDLMQKRDYCCIIGTKPADETLSQFAKGNGYTVVKEFPAYFDETQHAKLILWPRLKRMEHQDMQRRAIGHGLQTMFTQKNWAINADEVSYISNDLKLEPHLKLIWHQGRSLGISLVAGTQRPAFVPLLIYDQSTHLFFFRDNDETNLRRIGGIGWINAREIRETVARLPKHYFLYINSRTGEMKISKKDIQKKG